MRSFATFTLGYFFPFSVITLDSWADFVAIFVQVLVCSFVFAHLQMPKAQLGLIFRFFSFVRFLYFFTLLAHLNSDSGSAFTAFSSLALIALFACIRFSLPFSLSLSLSRFSGLRVLCAPNWPVIYGFASANRFPPSPLAVVFCCSGRFLMPLHVFFLLCNFSSLLLPALSMLQHSFLVVLSVFISELIAFLICLIVGQVSFGVFWFNSRFKAFSQFRYPKRMVPPVTTTSFLKL